MKTLEIIHLRLAGKSPEGLVETIRDLVGSGSELADVRIYRNCKLENDLAIQLHRENAGSGDNASEVGIRLASLLKEHGMVSHSIWTECCCVDENSEPEKTG